ncbi:MAG: hypothetical protein RLY31_2274 [Bacteroidota bacterium]|jgi:hypothetical protein
MNYLSRYLFPVVWPLIMFSCSGGEQRPDPAIPEQSPQGAPQKERPMSPKVSKTPGNVYAHGKINQVLVVADEAVWEGMAGDTLHYYFTAPYILLPQPEPIFDVTHLTPEELSQQPVRKEFRTILFLADLDAGKSRTSRLVRADLGEAKLERTKAEKGYNITVGQDKWAKDQLLLYVSGYGTSKLVTNIREQFPAMAARIYQHDEETVRATAYQGGRNPDLEAELMAQFGLRMEIPASFRKARLDKKSNTLWLRSDQRDIIANILVTKVPYTDTEQLSKDGIRDLRNRTGRIITTRQKGSHMRINDQDLPLFVEKKQLNNIYTVQAKGIWDIVNDFMGGPFVSQLMLNPATNELFLVDGFLYAPSKKKRNYMQEMELILSTVRF